MSYILMFSPAGLKEDFQLAVFKVLAAILHLGNVEIRESGGDKSFVSVSLDVFPSLLLLLLNVGSSLTGSAMSPSLTTLTWRSSASCWA